MPAASSCSTCIARSRFSKGTNKWSWWYAEMTLQGIFSLAKDALIIAMKPTASNDEFTLSVINAHSNWKLNSALLA